jgi:3-hydroxyisobutyrate dehydrogenase
MKTEKPLAGWIGAGVMGEPLCGHLLDAGYTLFINTRTAARASSLVDKGARWCATPAEVAAQADIIFTMVGVPDEVQQVYFGAAGIFSALRNNAVLVDMGTTPPSLTQQIAARAHQLGASAVDAPVSGGDVGARNATLSIMAGGDADVVERVRPLFDCMARSVNYMGVAGNGQHTKMCNQLVVAGTMIGVCEALVYAAKSGLDCERLVNAIRPGAAGCWTLENLAPRINQNDYAPGFMVDHFVKDLGIALAEAENLGLNLPGLMLALALYKKVQHLGHGQSGTQALIHALQTDQPDYLSL